MVEGKLESHMQNNVAGPKIHSMYKTISNFIDDLNDWSQAIKYMEETIARMLDDWFGNLI